MTGIVSRLRSGELSSVELTEQCLERVERLDDQLRVFVTVTADLAREQARAADEALAGGELLGALHGLPVAIKDNIDTARIRTTAGAGFLADRVPEEDAEVVTRLKNAGAVLVGKAQLHELAYGGTTQNPHFGPCRNPWNPERIPGGSSGGSGAAVAAGMCAAALGTDTGGSVRIPAGLNGVSGLRPTSGAISNRGLVWLSHTFDTIGPLARSVEDVAEVYAVLAGYDPEEPTSVDGAVGDPLAELELGLEGLRIALPASFYFDEADEPIVTTVRGAGETLASLGADVVEVELPGSAKALEAATWIIWSEALATHRERLEMDPDSFGEDVRRRLPSGSQVSGGDYGNAVQTGREWRRMLEGVFAGVDAILSPVSGAVAPIAAESEMIETTRRLTIRTYGWSLAGIPALSVPCGFSPEEDMPIGMQLAAPAWQESTLFRIAAAYQRATDWHLREPPLIATPAATG
jgi:aspartyl-tRNA(Asn)/glutamyl-tRNA(Gln) amidotransferase subunit A